jgi:succinoglycan biosynthesis transport protein ExoP
MTSIPSSRPIPMSRPVGAAPAHPSGAAMPAMDPVKLAKKYKWVLMVAAVAGGFLGSVVHVAWLMTYPIFSAAAYYECYPLEKGDGSGQQAIGSDEEFKRFMATQVQVMSSDRVIDKALSDPRMVKDAPRWTAQFKDKNGALDTQAAARELKKNLSAGVMGDTAFVRLSFWWTDRADAAAVVTSIGRAYEADRRQSSGGELADRETKLKKSIEEVNDIVKHEALDRQAILQEQKIESLDEHLDETNRTIANLQQKLIEVRGDREAVRVHRDKLADELNAPAGIQFPDAMRKTVDDDQTILRIKSDINENEAALRGIRMKLGDSHRTVVSLRNHLEGLNQQLVAEREKQLRQAFDSELDKMKTSMTSLDAQEADLLKKLDENKRRATELTQILSQVRDIVRDMDRQNEIKGRLQEDLHRLQLATRDTRVALYQPAQIPKTATFPRLVVLLPLGAFLGTALIAGLVVLVEIIDQRIKSPADVSMIPRTRVLGIVPHASEDPGTPTRLETVFRDLPAGVLAESYRQLRATLLKKMHQAGHKSLLVMSGMPGSGATSAVCNLAYAMAMAEQRVLVIDANFRRPAIHRILEGREGPGLSDVLANGGLGLTETVQKTGVQHIDLLSAGSPDKRLFERLSTAPMAEVLREAGEQYDIVLVDVAPAMVAGDALALANRCDATMLVVRAMGEKRGMVARLRNELSETRTDFLGVLVNAVRSSAGGYLKGNILASHRYQNGKE